MRLAVIADVHGNLIALETVLADIARRGSDLIVNLGDCVTSPLWPRETFELLEDRAMPTVRGNHDRWLAELPPQDMSASIAFTHGALTPHQRALLGRLPSSLELDGDGDESARGRQASTRTRLVGRGVFFGGVLRGGPRRGREDDCHRQSGGPLLRKFGSLTAGGGLPHARYSIETHIITDYSIDLIVLDYDWSQVAERAIANWREDWAAAFASLCPGRGS